MDAPNDEKYRTIRTSNSRIKESLTKYYNGTAILRIIGFQETYDQDLHETVLRMPTIFSISHMKGQRLDFDLAVRNFFN